MIDDCVLVDVVLVNVFGVFVCFVCEYQGLCWYIIQCMVCYLEDICELCQDMFLKVYQNLYQYCYESVLRLWIGCVVYIVVLCYLECKCIVLVDLYVGDDEDFLLLDIIGDGFDLEVSCVDEEMSVYLYVVIDILFLLLCIVFMFYYLDELSIFEIV